MHSDMARLIYELRVGLCHSSALNAVMHYLMRNKSKAFKKCVYVVTLDRFLNRISTS